MFERNLITSFLYVAMIVGCKLGGNTTDAKPVSVLDIIDVDTTCAPCDDFYQFANGGWIGRTPIPQGYAVWSSFHELMDGNSVLLHRILDSVAENRSQIKNPTSQKLAALYASCMDTVQIESNGAKPIGEELSIINALGSMMQVREYIVTAHTKGIFVLFSGKGTPDYKNSSEVILTIQQGGLGLPDRDYYLNTDTASLSIRSDYVGHIARILILAGQSPESALRDARHILDLETSLAKISMSKVEGRDPNRTYNIKSISQLRDLTPGFDWNLYLNQQGISESTSINVAQPNFFKGVNELINAVPVEIWKAYFRWSLIHSVAPHLNRAFINEDFDFFHRRLEGKKEQLPRYKYCVQMVDGMMGDALGEVYVAKHFPPRAKERALVIAQNVKEAFAERLRTRTWMSDSTRDQALKKLNTLIVKVGYPDRWKDYSLLDVNPDNSYFNNVIAARAFQLKDNLTMIGKPIDKSRWFMTPPTVNAYYDAAKNEIVFPAGILQPPFFYPDGEDAVNYGGIGAIMGHEISHGFDDYGSRFDGQGNLRNWFTETDLNNFKSQTKLVEDQFNSYSILDSVFVNGRLTLGENIADLGGITVAYHAFKKAIADRSISKIDGFTPEQRFFLAWAQAWRSNISDELSRDRIMTDYHSPMTWRANGPLTNLPEFAEAWGCSEGAPMVRSKDKRAEVW